MVDTPLQHTWDHVDEIISLGWLGNVSIAPTLDEQEKAGAREVWASLLRVLPSMTLTQISSRERRDGSML